MKTKERTKEVAEADVKELMERLYYGSKARNSSDFQERELCCTPFTGAYGRAGWVIAVNGSPPRGVLVALSQSVYHLDGKSKRLTSQKDIGVVYRYIGFLAKEEPAEEIKD